MHALARTIRPNRSVAALTATAVALLAGVPATAQTSAYPIVDAPTGISVSLHYRATAQEQVIPGTSITIRYYLVVEGQLATSFSVFAVTEADGGYDLDGGVQGSADGSGGTVVASAPIEHQGHAGRDFELDVTDASSGVSGVVLSRLLWTGQNVVQLQAVGPDDQRARVEELFLLLTSTLDLGAEAIASPGASDMPLGSPEPEASTEALLSPGG